MSSILDWTALELSKAVRAGDVTAADATEAYLARIEAVEPKINAYLRVAAKTARAAAESVDKKRQAGKPLGPLAGVPLALKDIFVTEGIETTCGSKILDGWTPPYDGTHARRLREADSVMLGKVSMDEFAMGSSNENSPHPPVRNPWDTDFVPGGSSGGSVAAVAARTALCTLGTDTGGSIRQPASLCNVVGLKPTYGRVSRHGMIAFASSLDQAGPVTRTVRDAALVLGAIAGRDEMDATTLDAPVDDYLSACDQGVAGLRIGVHRKAMELEGLDEDVRVAFTRSLEAFKELGATLVDVELPHFDHAVATYYILCTAEASSNLARYDGVRYGARVEAPSLLKMYNATREAGFGAEVKRRIMLGTFVLRASSYEEYYGRAMKVRTLIKRDYQAAFGQCDLIASPTSPVPGFRIGERIADPLSMYLSDVFTIGANLAGLPGISIPGGFSSAAKPLPIGLQLVGPTLGESLLFSAAAAYEANTGWHTKVAEL